MAAAKLRKQAMRQKRAGEIQVLAARALADAVRERVGAQYPEVAADLAEDDDATLVQIWNDFGAESQAEVVEVFDSAIARSREGKVRAALVAARQTLARPGGWARGAMGVDGRGHVIPPWEFEGGRPPWELD